MKLVIRGICVVALALTLAGLVAHLSAGSLSGSSALTREDLASGLVNLGGKLAIIGGLIAAFAGVLRAQWRWVAALASVIALTLFCGPLSLLTNTGVLFFFIGPIVATLLTIAYTFRTPTLTPMRV